MAVHVVPDELAVELVLVDVGGTEEELEELEELDELVLEIDVEVEVGLVLVDVETTAVKRHEQAVDTLEGRFEHWVA